MYGKIFDSIYSGTLYGQWEALVTMQQMIVLADADGVVDMTPMAISARTSIPREIIDKGLDILAAPDKYTRTPGSDGRRIELIDEHRPWGWILVNYEKYKALQDADTVRAQTRERVRKHRESKKKKPCNADVTEGNGQKRHIDIDIDIINTHAWQQFEAHREETKKPLTDRARAIALKKLEGLSHEDQQTVVNNTIEGGWTGLFPERLKKRETYKRSDSFGEIQARNRKAAGLSETDEGLGATSGYVRQSVLPRE